MNKSYPWQVGILTNERQNYADSQIEICKGTCFLYPGNSA